MTGVANGSARDSAPTQTGAGCDSRGPLTADGPAQPPGLAGLDRLADGQRRAAKDMRRRRAPSCGPGTACDSTPPDRLAMAARG